MSLLLQIFEQTKEHGSEIAPNQSNVSDHANIDPVVAKIRLTEATTKLPKQMESIYSIKLFIYVLNNTKSIY